MDIILGVIFLLAGRKIYWLFVASLGFLFGFLLSASMFFGQAGWKAVILPFSFGVLGLILAVFIQKAAVAFSGFLAGGYIFLSLRSLYGWHTGYWLSVFFIVSGIIGSGLFLILFNPALIVSSSSIGALLIVRHLPVTSLIKRILFTALFITGVLAQSNQLKAKRNSNKTDSRC